RAARAIDGIAVNGKVQSRAMDPQLMRPPSERLKRQPGYFRAIGVAPPAKHSPARLRWLALGIDFHPPAARGVEPAQRKVDQSFVFSGAAFDNGPIGLVDAALL